MWLVSLQIEESILDCLAWKSGSSLWTQITALTSAGGDGLPKSEEVSLPQQQPQLTLQHPLGSPLGSPLHPQIRRLAMSDGKLIAKKCVSANHSQHSLYPPSISDIANHYSRRRDTLLAWSLPQQGPPSYRQVQLSWIRRC